MLNFTRNIIPYILYYYTNTTNSNININNMTDINNIEAGLLVARTQGLINWSRLCDGVIAFMALVVAFAPTTAAALWACRYALDGTLHASPKLAVIMIAVGALFFATPMAISKLISGTRHWRRSLVTAVALAVTYGVLTIYAALHVCRWDPWSVTDPLGHAAVTAYVGGLVNHIATMCVVCWCRHRRRPPPAGCALVVLLAMLVGFCMSATAVWSANA